ncbi:MAG: hypothetical protein LBE71_05465, partial [Dysgonamonadaceae bacterium]|nr:hypothetical protein [Dysgonamonadaceae bacterium]
RHCELRSSEAIQKRNTSLKMDCFASLAMTGRGFSLDCRAAIAARNDEVGFLWIAAPLRGSG